MTIKIHFLTLPTPHTVDDLRLLLPTTVEFSAEPEPPPPDCDILVGGVVKPEHLAASPGLRAVIVPYAGVPVDTQELLRQHPAIALHNLHFNDVPTAEMALALLLAASKHLAALDHKLRQGDWRWDDAANPTDTLTGKTAVILGYGAIGRRIAPVCQALGMHVLGVRRNEPTAPMDSLGVEVVAWTRLNDVLPRADVLLCVLPETPETTGLIGARELGMLPHHAIVVNVGRGRTIDEEALYTALRDRRIRAAGIDVWYQYPKDAAARASTLPSRFPFQELDNVVLSPHRGGWLADFEHLRVQALAEMFAAAAAGRPLPNLVDKALGY